MQLIFKAQQLLRFGLGQARNWDPGPLRNDVSHVFGIDLLLEQLPIFLDGGQRMRQELEFLLSLCDFAVFDFGGRLEIGPAFGLAGPVFELLDLDLDTVDGIDGVLLLVPLGLEIVAGGIQLGKRSFGRCLAELCWIRLVFLFLIWRRFRRTF